MLPLDWHVVVMKVPHLKIALHRFSLDFILNPVLGKAPPFPRFLVLFEVCVNKDTGFYYEAINV